MAEEIKGREHLVKRQVAMTAVFKRFAPVWTKAFHANAWAGLLDTWIDNCHGIDTDFLDIAAREFMRSGKSDFPPKPWVFAAFARQLQAKQRNTSVTVGGGTASKRRIWEWQNPGSKRLARVEERDGNWVAMSVDDYAMFMAYEDRAKVEYCEHMVREHGLGAWAVA